jgi:hypothetical protein
MVTTVAGFVRITLNVSACFNLAYILSNAIHDT